MGRLIDADELKKDYPHDSDWEYPVNTNEYVCESIDNAPTVEAIAKAEYENRLKADMVAMFTELKTEIEEIEKFTNTVGWKTPEGIKRECSELVQQKIDKLRGEEDENNN